MAGLSSKNEAQARINFIDLKRDETMALNEYLQSPIAVKDLKSNPSKKKKGGTTAKKHIMELPTNVPRLQRGANLMNPGKADLDKDGNLSSYEKARGRAIEKNMANKKVSKAKDGKIKMSDQDRQLLNRMSDQDRQLLNRIRKLSSEESDQDKKISDQDKKLSRKMNKNGSKNT
jgi:hypothetical protein